MLIPLCDEIRRKRLPAITFLLVVLHITLFFSALDGQWLVTSGRMHEVNFNSGISHATLQHGEFIKYGTYWLVDKSWFALLANLAILMIFGPSLEDRAGKLLFLCIYFSSAVIGGIFHSLFPGHIYPTVMTCGAIAGLLGAYAVQIDLQTKIRTMAMWYEHPIPGSTLCFLWVFAQVILSNYHVCESGSASFAVILGGFLNGVLVGFFSREFTPNVVISRAGSLEMVSREHAITLRQNNRAAQDSQGASQNRNHENADRICPYCQNENNSPVQENNGAYYYQCAAGSCRRLVFLSKQAASRVPQPHV